MDKLDEYQRLGIPEYWIVDLRDAKVSVLLFNNERSLTKFRSEETTSQPLRYDTREFQGSEQIIFQTFPGLSLTAAQVLAV